MVRFCHGWARTAQRDRPYHWRSRKQPTGRLCHPSRDGVLVLMAPGDERGLGDVEFGGNAGKHPALHAQFDKALDSFLVVHTVLSGVRAGRADCL